MADRRHRRGSDTASYYSVSAPRRSAQHVPQSIEAISMHRAGGPRYVATAKVVQQPQRYVQYMDKRGLHLVPVQVVNTSPRVSPVIVNHPMPPHVKQLESDDGNWTIKATKRVAPKPPVPYAWMDQEVAVARSGGTSAAPSVVAAVCNNDTAVRTVYRPHTAGEVSHAASIRGVSRAPSSVSTLSHHPAVVVPFSPVARSATSVGERDRRDYFTYDTLPRNFFRQGKQPTEDTSGVAKVTIGARKTENPMTAARWHPDDTVYAGEVVRVTVPPYSTHSEAGSVEERRTVSVDVRDGDTEGTATATVTVYSNGIDRPTTSNTGESNRDGISRTIVLQRTRNGYGFVLRGAKSQNNDSQSVLKFTPTPELPALQYLDRVDKGSVADRAGLRPADFILEINGENVISATHERTVQLIKNSGDTLVMKVVTARSYSHGNYDAHMDGTRTLPVTRRVAPVINNNSVDIHRMNAAAVAHGIDPNNKTASIRSRHNKRMTSVPLDEIFSQSVDVDNVDALSHTAYASNDNMGRAISTPNLLGGHAHVTTVKIGDGGDDTAYSGECIYAQPFRTPPARHGVPDEAMYHNGNLRVQIRNKGGQRDMNTVIPPPPSHRAPLPPTDRTSSELVEINTNRPHIYSNVSHASVPAPVEPPVDEDRVSLYESSFRPGTNARLSKEPLDPPPVTTAQRVSTPPRVPTPPRVSSCSPAGQRQEYGHTDSPSAGQTGQAKLGILKGSRPDYDSDRLVKPQSESINSLRETHTMTAPRSCTSRESHTMTAPRSAAITMPPRSGLRTDIAEAIKLAADSRNRQAQENAAKSKQAPPPPLHAPPPPPPSHAPPAPPSHAPPTSRAPPPPSRTSPLSQTPTPPSSQASPQSSKIPTPPPPPPPQSQMPPPPPPPPVPSADITVSNDITRRPPQPRPAPEDVTQGMSQDDSRAALLAAVAKRRNVVDNSDMESLAESIETRIHRSKKLQTTMYKSDQTKRQLSAPDSPGKMATLLTDDVPKKPGEMKGAVSEATVSRPEQKRQQGEVNDSTSDLVTDDNFKSIAEKRRQEWLQKKTAGANSTPSSSPSRSSDGDETKDKEEVDTKPRKPAPTPPSKHFKPTVTSMQEPPPGLGGLAQVIAAKAQRIQLGNNKSLERNNNSNDERNANSGSNGHTVAGMNTAGRGSMQPDRGSRVIYTSPNLHTETGRQTRTDTSGQCDGPPPLVAGRHAMGVSHNGIVTAPANSMGHESSRAWSNGDNSTVGWIVNPNAVHETAIREKLSRLHDGTPQAVPGDDARVSSVSALVMMHEHQCVPQVVDISPLVDVDFIPPPLSFDSEPSHATAQAASARTIPEDSVSTVSSLSTLSTLSSTDHETHDFSHFRPAVAPPAIAEVESELLTLPPPPPPGFGDSPSASVDDLREDFLPPPADFGESAVSSAPVVTSLRNMLKASGASPHSVDMKSFRDKPVPSWTVTDVCDLLDNLHMGEHKQAFVRDQVNGQQLVHISRARLASLGVSRTVDQMRLEQAINRATL